MQIKHIDTGIIADQATSTCPNTFLSEIVKKIKADTYVVIMTLKAKSNGWRYVKGDWVKGWETYTEGRSGLQKKLREKKAGKI